ncbi:MAG TPA: SH3 domain-containing protein [Hyphomicrobiaceae bacterium]|nr:SH3 domain-containing protein [Hyphomicrobiaceae bacterium]
MLRPFLVASCLCAAAFAEAKPARLSGPEIRTLLAGATVEIDAPLGNRLPIRYERDGKLAGRARDLASYLGSASDTGKWWIASDQLCHKWKRWFNGEPQCFRLKAEGRRIHWWMQDGNTGTATITVPAPIEVAAAASAASHANAEKGAAPPPRVQAYATAAMLPLPSAPTGSSAPEPIVPPKPVPQAQAASATATARGTPPQPKADTPHAASPSPPALGRKPAVDSAWISSEPASQPPSPAEPAGQAPPPKKAEAAEAGRTERPAAPVQRPSRSAAKSQAKPVQPPGLAKRTAQPFQFTVINVAADDMLNIRSGPSAEHEVVGELQPGSRGVAITGACRSRWCPVAHRGASGWVNSAYLVDEEGDPPVLSDAAGAPRTCLTPAVRALLNRIEERFGRVKVISTCRPGATIAGTAWPSRHASGNAVDFNAGHRKAEIVEWLVANHRDGGTMTYPYMDHIHIDIGRHFVSLAGRRQRDAWRTN